MNPYRKYFNQGTHMEAEDLVGKMLDDPKYHDTPKTLPEELRHAARRMQLHEEYGWADLCLRAATAIEELTTGIKQ